MDEETIADVTKESEVLPPAEPEASDVPEEVPAIAEKTNEPTEIQILVDEPVDTSWLDKYDSVSKKVREELVGTMPGPEMEPILQAYIKGKESVDAGLLARSAPVPLVHKTHADEYTYADAIAEKVKRRTRGFTR